MASTDYGSGVATKASGIGWGRVSLGEGFKPNWESEDENLDTLLAAVRNLEKKRSELKATLTDLEQQTAVFQSPNPMREAQSILGFVAAIQGEELKDMRLRLRAVLGNLLDSIWVLPFEGGTKYFRGGRIAAHIQLVFKSGSLGGLSPCCTH